MKEFYEKNKNAEYIEFLSKYNGYDESIDCKCKVCRHEWSTTPHSLLSDKGCPICSKKRRIEKRTKTHEDFMKEFYEKNIHANDINILSKYINSNTKIECECKICGHTWSAYPFNLLYGYDCPKCAIRKQHDLQRKTHEQFMKEFYEKNSHAKDIEILGKYQGNDIPIHCKCKVDGHEWFPMPYTLLQNHGCLECAIRNNRGENHHNWNSNLTQEEREQGRKYPEYYEFVKKVFERDSYTCQVTGQIGGRLVVHHLYSYNKYTCLRTVMENGITISEEVHREFHKIYGKGNNTLEQWEEFINNKNNEVA
ncbi:MAG: zinc-ribbon domain-containing protein [Clostridia bacterium]|nr:zinc-ribbon domain-containing protein [Clostridia bacterium]